LYEFIKNILNQFKTVAEQYQIQLYFKPLNEKLTVRIDPQKLTIAFSNLIDNAIRYNIKNGKVEVLIEKTMIKQQPFAKIIIKDTGVGIPPTEIEKLFRKFYRGSNVVSLEPNGSGLGLYIAKNIIQQHGGEISVESIIDRGSTFSFTLPLNFSLIPNKETIKEEE
jgi:signal transduction histidine kinase